jgi:hypothetical protein
VTKLGATTEMVAGMLDSWGGYLKQASFFRVPVLRAKRRATGALHSSSHVAAQAAGTTRQQQSIQCAHHAVPRHVQSRDRPRPWPLVGNQPRPRETQAGRNRRCGNGSHNRGRAVLDADQGCCGPGRHRAGQCCTAVARLRSVVVCVSRRVPALLDPKYRQRIYRLQGWGSPVLLVNGHMAGVWEHEHKGRTVSVEIEPLAKLPR